MSCFKIQITVVLLFLSIVFKTYAGELVVQFYYQLDCPICEEIERLDLPRLQDKYGDRIKVIKYDTGDEKNFVKLLSALEHAGRESNATAHMVIGNTILCGKKEIRNGIDNAIDAALKQGVKIENKTPPDGKEDTIQAHSRKMTFAIVAGAGLIDGINPCVISALIFLMSVLAMAGIEGKKLATAGICYCSGSFVTYTLIGLGLLSAVRELSISLGLREWVNGVTIGILIIFAMVSIWDAVRFLKSQSGGAIIMKLPQKLQLKVHRLMRKASNWRHLVIGAFILGGVVTVIETLCTGQIYVPTLVYMLKQGESVWRHTRLLLLYNAMFTVPAVGVFALMLGGYKLKSVMKLGRKSVVWAKLAMALLFILMAVLLSVY